MATIRCFQSTNSQWTLNEATKTGFRVPRHGNAVDTADVPYTTTTFSYDHIEVDAEGYLRKVWMPSAALAEQFGIECHLDEPLCFLGCYAAPVMP